MEREEKRSEMLILSNRYLLGGDEPEIGDEAVHSISLVRHEDRCSTHVIGRMTHLAFSDRGMQNARHSPSSLGELSAVHAGKVLNKYLEAQDNIPSDAASGMEEPAGKLQEAKTRDQRTSAIFERWGTRS